MNQSLQNVGIVITRPLDQAKKLSELIQAEGGTPISFPLIDIAPLEDYAQFDATLRNVPQTDWIVFISSNAVQNGMPRLLIQFPTLPKSLKFAAIGPVTAQELESYGISQVLIPEARFDSESLLAMPELQHMDGQRVMIVRGIGGREVLADTLKARGAQVTFAECYRRVNPQADCDAIAELWQNKQCQAIVVTSAEAMRHLLQMTHNGTDEWLKRIAICVNHARIAEEARLAADANVAGDLHVTVAEAPGDTAMLACIKRALSKLF